MKAALQQYDTSGASEEQHTGKATFPNHFEKVRLTLHKRGTPTLRLVPLQNY